MRKKPDNLIMASMEQMPFEDNFFDILIGRFSIHYMKNLDNMYQEFSRVLKPNGIMIFTAHHPLLGFMQLGAKDYQIKKDIEMNLYKNSVTIKFPHHTLKEYFSDVFFENFLIDYLDEEKPKDMEYPNKWNIPGFIGFKAVKK